MKRLLALLVGALLLLSACGKQEPAPSASALPSATPSASPTPTPEPSPSPTLTPGPVWKELPTGDSILADDGTVVLTLDLIRPTVDNAAARDAYPAINRFFAAAEGEYDWAADEALDDYALSKTDGYTFTPHTLEESYQVTYETSGYASILRTVYHYTGSAYPRISYRSDTFDLYTGGRLGLEGLFTVEESVYKPRLLAELKAQAAMQIGDDGKRVLSDSDVENWFDFNDWYLSDQGLVVYYQGDLLPHAVGVLEFTIPYEKLEDIWAL